MVSNGKKNFHADSSEAHHCCAKLKKSGEQRPKLKEAHPSSHADLNEGEQCGPKLNKTSLVSCTDSSEVQPSEGQLSEKIHSNLDLSSKGLQPDGIR